MPSISLSNTIVTSALLCQIGLVVVLYRRKLIRLYPLFFSYLLANIIEDSCTFFIFHYLSPSGPEYWRFYFVSTVLDYILQIMVLWEVGRNVLRPSKGFVPLPVRRLATVAVLAAIVVAISFTPLASVLQSADARGPLVQVTVVLASLKIILFLAIAASTHVLGISWKSHVLQLASGLAFFGAISLLVQLSSRHVTQDAAYVAHMSRLNEIQSIAWLVTLLFWLWALSRNEAPRKDFTPQMEEVLVTIAQSAKRTRLAVTRSTDRR